MVDGIEGLFRSLVYRKGSGEVLIIHDWLLYPFCHYICETLDKFSVSGVTRLSPVIKTVPFAMFIPFYFRTAISRF